MQTTKLHYRFLSAAMRQLNPFGAVGENGMPMLFSSAREAYLHLFRSLRAEFPRGYVDLVLFSAAYQKLRKYQSSTIIRKRQYAVIEWGGNSQRHDMVLKAVCLKLQEVSGCQFDEQAFKVACYEDKRDMKESGNTCQHTSHSLLDGVGAVTSRASDAQTKEEENENDKPIEIDFSESKYGKKENTNQPATPKGNQEQQSPEHTQG